MKITCEFCGHTFDVQNASCCPKCEGGYQHNEQYLKIKNQINPFPSENYEQPELPNKKVAEPGKDAHVNFTNFQNQFLDEDIESLKNKKVKQDVNNQNIILAQPRRYTQSSFPTLPTISDEQKRDHIIFLAILFLPLIIGAIIISAIISSKMTLPTDTASPEHILKATQVHGINVWAECSKYQVRITEINTVTNDYDFYYDDFELIEINFDIENISTKSIIYVSNIQMTCKTDTGICETYKINDGATMLSQYSMSSGSYIFIVPKERDYISFTYGEVTVTVTY